LLYSYLLFLILLHKNFNKLIYHSFNSIFESYINNLGLDLKRYVLDHYVDNYKLKMHKIGLKLYEKPFTTLNNDHVASPYERDVADWLYRHHIKYTYEPKIAPGNFEMKPDFFIDVTKNIRQYFYKKNPK